MTVAAPGKVVMSGAYAVQAGAPAIVSAVSRYVIADGSRSADLATPEVTTAIGDQPAPWFDAGALRGPCGKLGLGSSAAIVVASLAALQVQAGGASDDETLCRQVYAPALRAHARAQGGGSGIDVAASAHGGTLICQLSQGQLRLERAQLPAQLHVEVWTSGQPASTPALLASVAELGRREPARHWRLLDAQGKAAAAAATALRQGDAPALIEQLTFQVITLLRLGDAAGTPIVTEAVARLSAVAQQQQAAVLPAGAGGGDVALYAGLSHPRPQLVELAQDCGYQRLDATQLQARGVHVHRPTSVRAAQPAPPGTSRGW